MTYLPPLYTLPRRWSTSAPVSPQLRRSRRRTWHRDQDLDDHARPAGRLRPLRGQAPGITAFLAKIYELVSGGQEAAHLDYDAELTDLLGRA